jgi:AcrR family transcriptional regulator
MNTVRLNPMSDDVKTPRSYHAPQRAEQAAQTRHAVLAAARELFTSRGYAATTVAQIAARAGVNVDTLYATVGRKPVLLREVLETAISGQAQAVPALQRDYVQAIQAAPTAAGKIDVYAAAVANILPRTAPIFAAIRDAGGTDPSCAALYTEITQRRAANMRLFVAGLRATGDMRTDLTDDDAADIVWAMNAAEYFLLLVAERGWTPARFGAHLADAWRRLLLVRS